MKEDGSVRLHIYHLLHINEYPIMPILTKNELTESVSTQPELPLSPGYPQHKTECSWQPKERVAKAGRLYNIQSFVAFYVG